MPYPWSAGNVLSASDLNAAFAGYTVNAQTGAGYTLVLADRGKLVTVSNGSAQNLTIPLNATVAYATGTWIDVLNVGAGTWTVTATGGVTLSGTTAIPTNGRVRLTKTGTDTWYSSAMDAAIGSSLAFITSATISAASSTIISNCFSSAYDVYQITFDNMTLAVGGDSVMMQLRTGGSTAATNYNSQTISAASTTLTGIRATGGTQARMFQTTTTAGFAVATLFGPFLARATYGVCQSSYAAAGTSIELQHSVFSHTTTTSYESLVINAATSTISGTVRIYGIKNS